MRKRAKLMTQGHSCIPVTRLVDQFVELASCRQIKELCKGHKQNNAHATFTVTKTLRPLAEENKVDIWTTRTLFIILFSVGKLKMRKDLIPVTPTNYLIKKQWKCQAKYC
jgi:hypothetical protein